MSPIEKSSKLDNVCYDIRGPVLKEAKRLEEEGNKVLKLNIGNPAPFGFEAPDEILVDVIRNLPTAQGYCDSKGLYSARKAIMQHYQARGMRDVTVEDIYIGNGVSELDCAGNAGPAEQRGRNAGIRAGLSAVDGCRITVQR